MPLETLANSQQLTANSQFARKHNNHMIRLTKYTIHLISGLLLALLTASCVADRNVSDCVAEGEEVEIEFALQVPALETSLRQLTADQESEVKSIKVLVFNTDGITDESQETLAYVATVSSTTKAADGITHIRCRLTATDKPMRIVCIANHDINTNDLVGKTKKVILEDATMVKSFTTEGWKTDGTQPIPMWGESDKQPINKTTRFNSCKALSYGNTAQNRNNEGVIHLVRALARVDVGVNFDETKPADENAAGSKSGEKKFKIKSVRVYRYAQSMYVTGTQATAFNFADGRRNALPHTPATMTAAGDTQPVVFNATEAGGVDGYVRNIYIPEIANRTKDKDTRTCLVVGGYYDNDTKETYYRIDFIRRESPSPGNLVTTQLDILRNYRYRFNITKIAGPGTKTPEEALITEPVNISYDLLVWDDAELDKIVYDGQYYLSVSKDKFTFGKNPADQSYKIRTNWPEGYKIVKADGTPWAKSETEATTQGTWAYFTEPAGQTFAIDQDQTSIITVLENKTGTVRQITRDQLFVQAGRIKWPLEITQQDKVQLDITLYEQNKNTAALSASPINYLQLIEGTSNSKLVAVRYTKDAKLERQPLNPREQFNWTKISDNPAEGKAVYQVEMTPGTANEEDFNITEVSRFRVTKEGAEAYADLSIFFMRYGAIPFRDRNLSINMLQSTENYVLINIPAEFYIKANAPYKLTVENIEVGQGSVDRDHTKVVHDWVNNMLLHQSDAGLITGEKILFQPYDWVNGETYKGKKTNPGDLFAAVVTFKIVSTDAQKPFKESTFKIKLTAGIIQPEANSYIMKSTQKVPILIPLSRINTAAEWYKQWEDECEEVAEARRDMTGEKSITRAQYDSYVADGKSALPRLEESDHNVEAALIWSTITSSGTLDPRNITSGIRTLKTVVVDGKNYLMVALEGRSKFHIGNAVVGVRRPGDKTKFLWSWHIWVVDGYPWESNNSGQSAMPFLNRNLGADNYWYGYMAGQTHLGYVGLFYQFGRKDPFYLDTYADDTRVLGRKVKIYLEDNAFELKEMYSPYGITNLTPLYTMKNLIRYPYQIAKRDRNDEYILEMAGPNTFRMNGAALWQGQAIYTRHDARARTNLQAHTIKTPFDPSPYGWKVPSVGTFEMGKIFEINPRFVINNGFVKAGYGPQRPAGFSLIYITDGLVHLHTATRDIGQSGNNQIFNNGAFIMKWDGSKWIDEFNSSAFYPNAPSVALPVRSILNENETDFLQYTEEGFYKAARR